MNNHWSDLAIDVVPGLTVVLVALAAAMPAYTVLHQSRRGRARSAVAYISGFFAGLTVTFLMAAAVSFPAVDTSPVVAGGLVSSFFCPFAGMARAMWSRPSRRKARTPQAT